LKGNKVGFMVAKRSSVGGIVVSLLAACLSTPTASQVIPGGSRLRLVSPEEGETIVQAAWELRRGLLPKPDCSHFVHAIYAQAGFDYKYAPAADIFDGIDSFQRVTKPQPGDLVVWQGHVGVVVDATEHSFYSSVLSGFAIEDYRSNYWLGRGEPRFYRYVIDDAHAAQPLARSYLKQPLPRPNPQPDSTSKDSLADLDGGLPAGGAVAMASSDIEIRDVIFVSQRKKPSKDEVLAAIIRSVDANGQRLLRNPSLDSQPSIAIAEQFTVNGLNIKDNAGWADLKVKRTASIQYGKADLNESTDSWRVRLNRREQGWTVLVPQDRIYLRRDLAVMALTSHLARVSRAPGNRQELKKLVRILEHLLSEAEADEVAGGSK
jgi:hypothetical protein